jgi:hypothetical protein
MRETLAQWTSDVVLFPVLQLAVVCVGAFVAVQEWRARRRVGDGGFAAAAAIDRGEPAMRRFYGAYAAINGLLVAVCLTVSPSHRALWVVVDTAIVVYVCLLNPWSRNVLLSFTVWLTKIEN